MANTSILAAFERMWQHVTAALGNKSDLNHNHNDLYYTEVEIDNKISTHKHDDLYDEKGSASSALSSAKLYSDGNLSTAKSYTDGKIELLMNNSSDAVDSIMELATAMEENEDVVSALENAIGTKANANDLTSHTGNKSNPHGVTKSQIGLGNVEDKSSETIRNEISKSNVTTALGYTPYTPAEVDSKLSEKANTSHGNHVPATQTASNKVFLRNDNTWATITPSNIGAAASSHDHTVANITDLTATATELNYMDGVTSNVQTQLDGKAPAVGVAYIDENDNETVTLTVDLTEIANLIGGDA